MSAPARPATLDRSLLRARLLFVLLAVLTIPCGLALRHAGLPLPRVLTKEGGDALYAALVYFLACFVWPAEARRARAAIAAVVFCFAIETGQLYHAPWIDTLRNTTLGGLVLGHGFHTADLVAYVIGVALGLVIERASRRAVRRANGT